MKTVHIVYGPPLAGKSTFVRENMGPDDLVFDMDAVQNALCYGADHAGKPHTLGAAIALRNAFIAYLNNKRRDARGDAYRRHAITRVQARVRRALHDTSSARLAHALGTHERAKSRSCRGPYRTQQQPRFANVPHKHRGTRRHKREYQTDQGNRPHTANRRHDRVDLCLYRVDKPLRRPASGHLGGLYFGPV